MESRKICSIELVQIAGELHNMKMVIDRTLPVDTVIVAMIEAIVSTIKRGDPGSEYLVSMILIAAKKIELEFPGIDRVAAQAAKRWDIK